MARRRSGLAAPWFAAAVVTAWILLHSQFACVAGRLMLHVREDQLPGLTTGHHIHKALLTHSVQRHTTAPETGLHPHIRNLYNTAANVSGATQLAAGVAANASGPAALVYPLWWFAPFFSGSGYGLEAQHYMLSLLREGLVRPEDLWLSHHGDDLRGEYTRNMPKLELGQLQAMARRTNKKMRRRAIVVCHSLPYFWRVRGQVHWRTEGGAVCPGTSGRRAYIVGRTMPEADGIPADMVDACNRMGEVWVPSQWARDVFVSSGVKPEKVVVVPEGVNTTKFDPARYQPVQLPRGDLVLGRKQERSAGKRPFVFLSMFKWEARKGYDILLKAFLSEFQQHEPVELHIMSRPFVGNASDMVQWVHDWVRFNMTSAPCPDAPANSTDGANCTTGSTEARQRLDLGALPTVYLNREFVQDEDLPRYYRAADAFVLPSRGEGWGRPHVEAMSMGLPLISTNWSSITAYLDASVGYPLAVESLVEADGDNAAYFNGFKWAQPSVAHLRQLMRHVVNNPQEARVRGQAARERMVTEYSNRAVGLKILKEVNRITLKVQQRAQQRTQERLLRTEQERAQERLSQLLQQHAPELPQQQGWPGRQRGRRRRRRRRSRSRAHLRERGLEPHALL